MIGLARGFNMFHYPAYFDDEGTYVAQAWAVMIKGQLSHYTYWYDHPPLGWIQIGIWSMLTGGFETFGTAVNSGRFFIFILALGTCGLLYRILRSLNCSWIIAGFGTLLFGLSPFGIQFGRMVFLDNIMSFWLLFSLYFILKNEKRLIHIIVSAICFGIAFLSKEVATIFLPPMLLLIYFEFHPIHRSFAIVKWVSISMLIMFTWVVFAELHGELFPMGSFFDTGGKHVSLISTIQYQLSRKGNGTLFTPGSDMHNLLTSWTSLQLGDVLLIGGGLLASFVNLFIGIKKKYHLVFALFTVCFFFFFGRGGQVYTFYILPLLPLLAINISLLLSFLAKNINIIFRFIKIPTHTIAFESLFAITLLVCFFFLHNKRLVSLGTTDQTTPQVQTEHWIVRHINPKSFIVTDDYAYVDLYYLGFLTPKPVYYWKVERDPSVRDALLKNRWDSIDYIILTPSVRSDVLGFSLLKQALRNSVTVQTYQKDDYSITINQVQSPKHVLAVTWDTYKKNFISTAGFTNDKTTQGLHVTSEGQSYALLRSVLMGDKATFNSVLNWTVKTMKNSDTNLFASEYGDNKNGKQGIINNNTATDADEDMTLSLIFAYKQWGNPSYLTQAKDMMNNIWKYETVEIGGKRYVVAGNWASQKQNSTYTINPSSLSPYAYRIFAKIDKSHNWMSLVDTSYDLLQKCSNAPLSNKTSAHIPPERCGLDKNGNIVPATAIANSSDYSYDAVRTLWRVALDYTYYKDKRALLYLESMPLWTQEWKNKQEIYAIYTHEGIAKVNTESLAQYGIQMAYFSTIDKNISEDIYEKKILTQYNFANGQVYWGDKNNYYDQNWVWFATALLSNNFARI